MLKSNRMHEKWKLKLSRRLERDDETKAEAMHSRYGLMLIPLVTVLREGLEACIFMGGVNNHPFIILYC